MALTYRLPYFWLCPQAQVLPLPLLEAAVQGQHSSQAPCWAGEAGPGGRASAAKEEPARGQGWKHSREPSPAAEAEAFPASPAKRNAAEHEGAALSPLAPLPLLLVLLSLSQQLSPQPATPSSSSLISLRWLWWMEGGGTLLGNLSSHLWTVQSVQLQQSFNLPLKIAGYFLLEKRCNGKVGTMSPVGFLPMMS